MANSSRKPNPTTLYLKLIKASLSQIWFHISPTLNSLNFKYPSQLVLLKIHQYKVGNFKLLSMNNLAHNILPSLYTSHKNLSPTPFDKLPDAIFEKIIDYLDDGDIPPFHVVSRAIFLRLYEYIRHGRKRAAKTERDAYQQEV